MSLFDESSVEAGHHRLASSISGEVEVLNAATDLICKALLAQDKPRDDPEEHARFLTISMLGFRIVNGVAATTKLLDCGYFVQAAGLCRDIAEVGMLALHFAEEPGEIAVWQKLTGKKQHEQFGPGALRRKVLDKGKIRILDQSFKTFSDYGTHPSTASIIAHHDGTHFQFFPYINEPLFINTYKDLAVLTWRSTDACGDAYRAIFGLGVNEILPLQTKRFADSWNGIAAGIYTDIAGDEIHLK